MLDWIPGHAAFLISMVKKGDDGRTSFERLPNRKCRRPAAAFGEKVHLRPVIAGRKKNGLEPNTKVGN